MFAKTASVFAGLVAATSAHMFMAYPPPFPGTSNSPLEENGSNFPCHATSAQFFTGGAGTTWALGSKQTLSTKGTAVHGGGSGQFSITYDLSPTKDTVWKVIHSVEGGMPARGAAGNLAGSNAEAPNPDTYDFTVPSDLPAGEALFAWSWLNRIGNREFYMACSPITLTGTGGSKSNFEALPDMVVLNIMGKPKTSENSDYEFANPGASVENNLGKYGFSSELCCEAGCGESVCTRTEGGSGSGSGSGGSPAPSATPTAQPTASIPGGVFITVAPIAGSPAQPTAAPTSTAAPAPSAPVAAPAPSSVVVAPPVSSPSAAPSPPVAAPPASGSSGSLTGACSTEGQWNCIDGKSFQQCASGTWSAVMAVAQGTTCQTGQSSSLSISAAKIKRVVRAFRA